jgi:NAD-dependent deacetylase
MFFVLTGSGISQESGLDTFRGEDGLWSDQRLQDVASLEAFRLNPSKIYNFYNQRRRELVTGGVEPNAAHLALAKLQEGRDEVLLVTQNVDDLHERAGSKKVLHLRGQLKEALCMACLSVMPWADDLGLGDRCPICKKAGTLRPNIVWLGEKPYHLDDVYEILKQCRVFTSVGASGDVHPASAMVKRARASGLKTMEFNFEPSIKAASFDEGRYGHCVDTVPAWVEEVLAAERR